MIWYRLMEDSKWLNLKEGSCINEERYKKVYYVDKPLFEPVEEYEIVDMVEYKDDEYCILNGIEKVLFYTQNELAKFLEKINE